ncbi:hypothetical protein ACFPM0_14045 [Pseudonocardia sulfidoxydans]|uniref:hypothetical protein n=1 Tax=Pseudonocardia sulfidoxydans TaxID=54011 RepID=UPI0036164385
MGPRLQGQRRPWYLCGDRRRRAGNGRSAGRRLGWPELGGGPSRVAPEAGSGQQAAGSGQREAGSGRRAAGGGTRDRHRASPRANRRRASPRAGRALREWTGQATAGPVDARGRRTSPRPAAAAEVAGAGRRQTS